MYGTNTFPANVDEEEKLLRDIEQSSGRIAGKSVLLNHEGGSLVLFADTRESHPPALTSHLSTYPTAIRQNTALSSINRGTGTRESLTPWTPL